jgi:hypothetical protein
MKIKLTMTAPHLNGTRRLSLDPDNAASVRDTVRKMVGHTLTGAEYIYPLTKIDWCAAVAAGETELGFSEWKILKEKFEVQDEL